MLLIIVEKGQTRGLIETVKHNISVKIFKNVVKVHKNV